MVDSVTGAFITVSCMTSRCYNVRLRPMLLLYSTKTACLAMMRCPSTSVAVLPTPADHRSNWSDKVSNCEPSRTRGCTH